MKSKSEEFCKDSFNKYLKKIIPSFTIFWQDVEQKDEPPDYYVTLNNLKYAVEVTIIVLKVDVGAKKFLPVGVVRDCLRKFVVDEVETVARSNSFLQGAYLVRFTKPITDFANNKSSIQSELLSYISATQVVSEAPQKLVYKHNREKCLIEKLHNEENKVIMGGPTIGRRENEALVEVKQLLENRLDEKQHKLSKITYPKILLLHDRYYFLDLEDYKACNLTVSSLQSFHTVFIVSRNNEGQVLHSQNITWAQSS